MNDPIAMYLADIYTVMANLAGIPAISLPLFKHRNGMPFGLQVMASRFDEVSLLQVSNSADAAEKPVRIVMVTDLKKLEINNHLLLLPFPIQQSIIASEREQDFMPPCYCKRYHCKKRFHRHGAYTRK